MNNLLAWLDQTFDPHNDPPEVAKDIELLRWMAGPTGNFQAEPDEYPGQSLRFWARAGKPGAARTATGDTPFEALRLAVERLKGLRK